LSEAQRLTHWDTFGSEQKDELSTTADGESPAVCKGYAQGDVFVADFRPNGKTIKTPRRLTIDEADNVVCDWTADSRVVFFHLNRNEKLDIFKQDLSQTDAETVVASRDNEQHPILSPDGAIVLYMVPEKSSPDATRLMRVPIDGGPPELVLTGEKIKNFSSAREAKLCVVAEEVDGKQILTLSTH
jgi:Tol biopolymer transport system component